MQPQLPLLCSVEGLSIRPSISGDNDKSPVLQFSLAAVEGKEVGFLLVSRPWGQGCGDRQPEPGHSPPYPPRSVAQEPRPAVGMQGPHILVTECRPPSSWGSTWPEGLSQTCLMRVPLTPALLGRIEVDPAQGSLSAEESVLPGQWGGARLCDSQDSPGFSSYISYNVTVEGGMGSVG